MTENKLEGACLPCSHIANSLCTCASGTGGSPRHGPPASSLLPLGSLFPCAQRTVGFTPRGHCPFLIVLFTLVFLGLNHVLGVYVLVTVTHMSEQSAGSQSECCLHSHRQEAGSASQCRPSLLYSSQSPAWHLSSSLGSEDRPGLSSPPQTAP